jgi:hypothetical protein
MEVTNKKNYSIVLHLDNGSTETIKIKTENINWSIDQMTRNRNVIRIEKNIEGKTKNYKHS